MRVGVSCTQCAVVPESGVAWDFGEDTIKAIGKLLHNFFVQCRRTTTGLPKIAPVLSTGTAAQGVFDVVLVVKRTARV